MNQRIQIGDVRIGVDTATSIAVSNYMAAHGVDGWMRYVYAAINFKFLGLREPALDLRMMNDLPAMDNYSPEYMDVTFARGNAGLSIMLFQFPRIQEVAQRQKMDAGEFVHQALASWAAVPKGLAPD